MLFIIIILCLTLCLTLILFIKKESFKSDYSDYKSIDRIKVDDK